MWTQNHIMFLCVFCWNFAHFSNVFSGPNLFSICSKSPDRQISQKRSFWEFGRWAWIDTLVDKWKEKCLFPMIENDQDYTFLTCFSKGWVERWNWVLFVRLNTKILRICLVLFKQRVFAYAMCSQLFLRSLQRQKSIPHTISKIWDLSKR